MNGISLRFMLLALSIGFAGSANAQSNPDPVARRIAVASVAFGTQMDPASPGLAALGRAVGDARIVLLGEPWHGDGAAMAQRARVVEYLHEAKNFDVLVFESDFYALHRG